MVLVVFNELGEVTGIVRFGAYRDGKGLAIGVEVPANTWHTVIALEPNSILLEVKAGPFNPNQPKNLAPWSPDEGSLAALPYLNYLTGLAAINLNWQSSSHNWLGQSVGAKLTNLCARQSAGSSAIPMNKLIKLLDRSEAFHLTVVLGWCLAMMAVTTLALLPVEHLQLPVFDWWDKAQHALAFAVLTGWALLLWPQWAWRVVLGMLAYGAGIELAQWAVGWRFAEWADLAADAVGVLVAWGGLGGWVPRSSRGMTTKELGNDK